MKQMETAIQERYERMHRKLDGGMSADDVIREELSEVFPNCDHEKKEKIISDLKEGSLAFSHGISECDKNNNISVIWEEKLDDLNDNEKLEMIHSCRLLHDMMTDENIRLVYEGKLEINEEKIQENLKQYDTGKPVCEQVEDFLVWTEQNDFLNMEERYWNLQEKMAQGLKELPVEEKILMQFYQKVNSVEERAVYSCAWLAEMNKGNEDPAVIAPVAAIMANRSAETEKVYLELAEEVIDEEEAMTRLEKIWSIAESFLIEWLPVLLGIAVMALVITPFLFIPDFPVWGLYPVYAAGSVGMIAAMMWTSEPCERMLHMIGNKISILSRQKQTEEEMVYESVFSEKELELAELID